jgi:hypothetical protein
MTQPRTWRQPAKSTAIPVYGHCANRGCLCAVEPGERYCSDYCAAAADSVEAADTSQGCGCGHPECA